MVTASIVTYQHRIVDIQRVVDCILATLVDRLYIIDNSLNDKLRELTAISERICYIHSVNLGYGTGHNVAVNEAIEQGATYHVVINPDIYFEKDVIEELVQYANEHEEVGLLMPKILYPNGEIQYLCKLLPTPSDLLMRRFNPFKKSVERKNRRYAMRFADYDSIMEVPSLSGCFMFLRLSVLKRIGGFDERFFMYAEDLDLCRRIGEVSKTVYYPKVCVYHEYAKGSYKNKKLLRYHICSIIKYFNKWGWFWDEKRKLVNSRTLKKYR